MIKKLIWNDIKGHKLHSVATCLFMAITALLFGVTILLFGSLLSSVSTLMEKAQTPDFLQMHSGEISMEEIETFAQNNKAVSNWQVNGFLNLENGLLTLDGHSLSDSTQDNGLWVQSEKFDYLLTMENEIPEVLEGEVYVPVCYMQEFLLQENDVMQIGKETFVIAGFIRDSQMNSTMASSKRFLVSKQDYERLKEYGSEEYLIEFLLEEGSDTDLFATSYVDAGLPANGPTITYPLIRLMNALSDGLMIFIILLVAIMVLFISMLCIRFILLTGLERDRKEIGMLKAVGIPKTQIRFLYFFKFICLSGIGMIAGLLMAYVLQKPLLKQMQELYGAGKENGMTFLYAIVCVLLIQGVLLWFIWRLLKRTEKLSAIEALYGIQGEILSDMKKSTFKQYGLICVVTAICIFLMLMPQNLSSTISSPEFVNYMGIGDGQIRLDVRQTGNIMEKTKQLEECLQTDKQVNKFTSLQTKSCAVILEDESSVNLTVEVGDHTIFPVKYASGQAPVLSNEMALSVLLAEDLNLSVGDTLLVNDRENVSEYVICGIYSDITNGGKTAKAASLPNHEEVMWSIFYVTLNEQVDENEWINEAQKPWNQNEDFGVKVISIDAYVKGTYGQTIEQIGLAAKVAVCVAAVILWVVILLFMQLVISQQRYEISLRKALGFTGREINSLYLKKSFLCILTGILAGLVFGNIAGNTIAEMMLASMGAAGFSFILNKTVVFGIIPGIVLVIGLLAAKMGMSDIKRIKAYECCMGERN